MISPSEEHVIGVGRVTIINNIFRSTCPATITNHIIIIRIIIIITISMKKKRSNDRLLSNNETFNRNVSSSSIRQPHDAIKHYINIAYKKEVSCFTKYAGLKLICGQSSRLHFEQKDKKSKDRRRVSAKAKMRQLVNL